jgi:hypothetical protein
LIEAKKRAQSQQLKAAVFEANNPTAAKRRV